MAGAADSEQAAVQLGQMVLAFGEALAAVAEDELTAAEREFVRRIDRGMKRGGHEGPLGPANGAAAN